MRPCNSIPFPGNTRPGILTFYLEIAACTWVDICDVTSSSTWVRTIITPSHYTFWLESNSWNDSVRVAAVKWLGLTRTREMWDDSWLGTFLDSIFKSSNILICKSAWRKSTWITTIYSQKWPAGQIVRRDMKNLFEDIIVVPLIFFAGRIRSVGCATDQPQSTNRTPVCIQIWRFTRVAARSRNCL